VGTSRLDQVAPGQEFEVFLGTDDRIAVDRELVARDVDKTLLGNRRRIRFAYRVKAQNLNDRRITLHVWDQIPVPRHEDIRVQLERGGVQPDETDALGTLKWKLMLEPGEKRSIEFAFSVEHMRDARIAGLPE